MKNLALVSLFAFLLISCGGQKKQQQNTDSQPETEIVVLTVDDLYENAADMVDKEVIVKGTVMHVCKQGGGRCFLMGSNEEINIRVEAGEKIGAFNQEQMGSELEIVGIFKEVKTEADAHNPAGEHGEGDDHEHDAEMDEAHRIIAESEEEAEVVYFIEGLKAKEL
ncbi:MAG: hypothetical protein HN778_01260 [Prolixibacteraceae bacterium]|jgi:hypothetical protein|nr:hypothetical protein [Prolixibacteraceae bacterium]MBT6006647.1 hypothetical protein [Prolixibacteraceae bacterium]MBT6767251.1 hypothetical protein [Prolixibacteraceae bacterium]MBT6999627.1 hypothetical protein [Prolixibacteraceae bacterium]MBT7393437.1 hypothetical protein [Prolixibacteraceae bacterium]